MIKSKGILTISIISLFAVESAYAAIASSGYVDQQVGTKISEVTATETGTGNVVSSISAEGNTVTATKGITAEETKNKVNTIRTDGTATDTAYPSEKAVATALDAKQDKLEGEVLTNTATGTDSFSTGDANVASTDGAVSIGSGSAVGAGSVAVGDNARAANSAVVIGSGSSLHNNVVVGVKAYGTGDNAVSIGNNAYSNTKSVAIGSGANAQNASNMIAIGNLAKTSADYAIQLGDGTNSEANTFSVGLSDSNNYKLLGSDGKIPAERLPDGILTNTAASGGFSTNPAAPAGPMSVALGTNAQARGNNAVAVGNSVQATQEAVAIGLSANAGNASIALGVGADASIGSGVAIGVLSTAGAGAAAVGANAKANADGSIQLGDGTNSEANTFSVGFDGTNNYKLLGSDGKIPAERLPFEGDVLTNTATGSGSFSTGDANVASADRAVAIGSTANAGNTSIALGHGADASAGGGVAIGTLSTAKAGAMAVGANATADAVASTVIGSGASATGNGSGSVAIGGGVSTTGRNAVAVGASSQASAEYSVAIGSGSTASATRAIQLGDGTNSEANTFSVGLDGTNNYKLLGSDGKIPADRLPVATSSTLGGVKSGGDISISSTGAVSVVSALKAVQDANGANIAATYATKNSVEDLQANKVKVDWTTSNVNKVLVIGSDSNYPDVYGKVTVAKITENFLDNAIKNKLSNAVTSVATSGSGAVVTGFSKSGNSMTVTKSNVKIPVGSATATTYATIWVE